VQANKGYGYIGTLVVNLGIR